MAENAFDEIMFEGTKALYSKQLMSERDEINKYLKDYKSEDNNFKVTYTHIFNGKGKFSDWLGIDVIINEEKVFFISLQAFDNDKNTGNCHVLQDYIGIYPYRDDIAKKYIENKRCTSVLKTENAVKKMIPTKISLPMNESKYKILIDALGNAMKKKNIY